MVLHGTNASGGPLPAFMVNASFTIVAEYRTGKLNVSESRSWPCVLPVLLPCR